MAGGVGGIAGDRRFESEKRLSVPVQTLQRDAKIVVRLGLLWINLKRGLESSRRLGRAIQLQQHGASIEMRLRIVGTRGENAIKNFQRFLGVAALEQGDAKIEAGGDVVRAKSHGQSILGDGLLQSVGPL